MTKAGSTVRHRLDALAARTRVVWWASFGAVFLLGALWSLASPLSSAPDEPGHLNYAAAIWHGDVLAEDVVPGDADFPASREPVARHLSAMSVPAWVQQTLTLPDCYAFFADRTADCSPELGEDTSETTSVQQFGRYPPAYYVIVGWPTTFLAGDAGYHAVRLVSAALCAALVASAIVSMTSLPGRRRFAIVGVALSVTPMVVFLFGTVTSSGLEIAAALAFVCAGLDLLRRMGPPPLRLVVRVTVAGTLLAWARPSGFTYVVLLAVMVGVLALRRDHLRILAASRPVRTGGAILVVAVVGAALWVLAMRPDEGLLGFPMPGVSFPASVRRSLELAPGRITDMVGVFGWLDAPLPVWIQLGWLAAVAALVVAALWLGRWRERAALVLALGTLLVLPLLLEYRAVEAVGFVWQGRYSLPFAIAVPLLAGWIVAMRARGPRWALVAAPVAVAVAVSLVQLLAHTTALDRYVHGLPATWFAYLGGGAWRPPLGVKGQLALGVAASGAWAVVLAWLGLSSGPTEPAPTGLEPSPGAGAQRPDEDRTVDAQA